jgi:hypothetical protein
MIWLEAPRRDDIARATDHLDADLQIDAHRKGVMHPNNLRAVSRASVTLFFRVDEADRKVFVDAVRLTESN